MASNDAETMKKAAGVLGRINQDTAELFKTTMAAIENGASPRLSQLLVEGCLNIADSGWRSHEVIDLLLQLARVELHQKRLVDIVRMTEQLSGYSYEPALSYLRLLCDRKSEQIDDLLAVEQTGLSLHLKFKHASGLVCTYFNVAVKFFSLGNRDGLLCWVDVVRGMLEAERNDLTQFFELSDRLENVSWGFAGQCQRKSTQLMLIYLRHVDDLMRLFSSPQISLVEAALLRDFPSSPQELIISFLSLDAQSPEEVSLVLGLGVGIEDGRNLAAFTQNASELPIRQENIVREWIRLGNEVARTNESAGRAYFNLESARSIEVLAKLRGEVEFENHRKTFDLLAEAITAKNLVVEPFGRLDAESSVRHGGAFGYDGILLPNNDGKVVKLPERVNIFPDEVDNFGFYKVSLFHQLGYFEFGCFAEIEKINAFILAHSKVDLAKSIFLTAENARIDWQMANRYPGMHVQLKKQKKRAGMSRPVKERSRQGQLLEALVHTSLDLPYEKHVKEMYWSEAALLGRIVCELKYVKSSVDDVLSVVERCYRVIDNSGEVSGQIISLSAEERKVLCQDLPEAVSFRGEIDVEQVKSSLKIDGLVEQLFDELEVLPDQAVGNESSGSDEKQMELGDLKKGDVGEGVAMLLTELVNELGSEQIEIDPENKSELAEFLGAISGRSNNSSEHQYDEWDYQISDYRLRWCTLFEHTQMEMNKYYVPGVLREHKELGRKIRKELNKIRPEMLRKVRGFEEGEELDLERAISFMVDRKAGLTPDEKIYVQRQRKDRDVSTLFLVDMSASTDDVISAPNIESQESLDLEFKNRFDFFQNKKETDDVSRRIIDVEKEAVVLMADALEALGDSYSVCGFSGYGRDQVDYYLCKDFDESFNDLSKARIGGIKPCRSTRMGPPIRHATQSLLETGSRIKAMIIMSDGYPQDHDYGADRNSREYGLMDTMKALSEAKQQGVLTYCLTVDPSGHDYLRAMCPDSQYMVIQDLAQLPEEVSRAYRSLTG